MLAGLVLPLFIVLLTAFGIALFFYKSQFGKPHTIDKIVLGDPLNIKNAVFFGTPNSDSKQLVLFSHSHFCRMGLGSHI